MKLAIVLSVLFGALVAQADSFTIIRGGNEYLCQQVQNRPDPNVQVRCANRAYNGPFSKDQAMRLCQGALSEAPADCGIRAYNGPFAAEQAVELCREATGTGPADCGIRAYNGPFSQVQALRLCRRTGTVQNADCAIQAYSPYSAEEAIRLCVATDPTLVMRALTLAK